MIGNPRLEDNDVREETYVRHRSRRSRDSSQSRSRRSFCMLLFDGSSQFGDCLAKRA